MLVAEAEADRYNSQLYESLFLLHRCSWAVCRRRRWFSRSRRIRRTTTTRRTRRSAALCALRANRSRRGHSPLPPATASPTLRRLRSASTCTHIQSSHNHKSTTVLYSRVVIILVFVCEISAADFMCVRPLHNSNADPQWLQRSRILAHFTADRAVLKSPTNSNNVLPVPKTYSPMCCVLFWFPASILHNRIQNVKYLYAPVSSPVVWTRIRVYV